MSKLIDVLTPDFKHEDDRGTLTQLVRRGYSQINVVTSKAGVFRGGHFHKLNTEAYYIIKGSCRVTAYRDRQKESVVFKEGEFFRIGPYVVHDFDYLEDSILVTMYSLGIELDDETKDSYIPVVDNN